MENAGFGAAYGKVFGEMLLVLMQEFEGFYCHLDPNSFIVTVMNGRAQQGRSKSIPKEKDSKTMDLMGRKIYTCSSLQMQIAKHQALLSKYNKLDDYM